MYSGGNAGRCLVICQIMRNVSADKKHNSVWINVKFGLKIAEGRLTLSKAIFQIAVKRISVKRFFKSL